LEIVALEFIYKCKFLKSVPDNSNIRIIIGRVTIEYSSYRLYVQEMLKLTDCKCSSITGGNFHFKSGLSYLVPTG
jgi:hypothetical protein